MRRFGFAVKVGQASEKAAGDFEQQLARVNFWGAMNAMKTPTLLAGLSRGLA
jgi:hypothetical protein